MTLNQFLRDLASVDRTWSLIDGNITSDDELCPIREVWNAIGDEDETPGDYFEEGVQLGLRRETVSKIAAAADNRGHPELRKRLLKMCGISEATKGATT